MKSKIKLGLGMRLVAGGLGIASLAAACGASEPYLRKLRPTPEVQQPANCQLALQWVGQRALRAAVSDPNLQPDQQFVGISITWGDNTLTLVDQPHPPALPTDELSADHAYPQPGVYELEAHVRVVDLNGTSYSFTSSNCKQTLQIPHTEAS